jgi:hypothetical protein
MFLAVAFALFCVVCSVFAFRRHPIYGLYFYLATTYVFPPGRWWGYVFGDMRWALLSAGVTALAILLNRGKLASKPLWLAHPPVLLLILYVIWMGIQFPWALSFDDHLKGTSEFIKCLFSLWFVYRVVDSKENLRNLMFAHVLGCGLLGVYAQMQGREGDRLDGVGGPNLDDANTLGMFLVTGLMCGIGLLLTQKGWRRYVTLLALPVIANGVVLANSRGSFLGFVAGGLVLAFAMARQYRGMFWGLVLVGAIGLGSIVDQVFIDRMFTISDVTSQDVDADTSARSRLFIAKAQIEMFLDYPMGSGFRGTAELSPRYIDPQWLTGTEGSASRSSHNTYLTTLAEQGLPGAVIYAFIVLWNVGAIFRVRRLNRPGGDPELMTLGASLCGAIIVILVAGVTADYLIKEIQFWLYAGLVSVFWLDEFRPAPDVPLSGDRILRPVHPLRPDKTA